jgi:hypothetical protein
VSTFQLLLWLIIVLLTSFTISFFKIALFSLSSFLKSGELFIKSETLLLVAAGLDAATGAGGTSFTRDGANVNE